MSLQLVQYSDSEEDTNDDDDQDAPQTVKPSNEQKANDKKRKRSQIDGHDADHDGDINEKAAVKDHNTAHGEHANNDNDEYNVHEPVRKRQKTEETHPTKQKKKKIKLSTININEKLSNGISDNVEFLQSAQQQRTEFVLENVMENELAKIEETNKEKQHRIQYEKRLRKLEMIEARKEEGIKKKKEHRKYLKHALKEHIEEYGHKATVKGVGKGGHTKNQRIAW